MEGLNFKFGRVYLSRENVIPKQRAKWVPSSYFISLPERLIQLPDAEERQRGVLLVNAGGNVVTVLTVKTPIEPNYLLELIILCK